MKSLDMSNSCNSDRSWNRETNEFMFSFHKDQKTVCNKEESENRRFYSLFFKQEFIYLFPRPSSSDCRVSSKWSVWYTRPEFP